MYAESKPYRHPFGIAGLIRIVGILCHPIFCQPDIYLHAGGSGAPVCRHGEFPGSSGQSSFPASGREYDFLPTFGRTGPFIAVHAAQRNLGEGQLWMAAVGATAAVCTPRVQPGGRVAEHMGRGRRGGPATGDDETA